MRLPTLTRAQLEPLVERLVTKDAPLILVKGDPDAVPQLSPTVGNGVAVMGTSSPLAIRAALAQGDEQRLVVVTGCDGTDLGLDLLSRAVGQRVHVIESWETIKHLFGVENITADLAEHPEVANFLIENRPVAGYRRLPSKVLDTDQALDVICSEILGFRGDGLGSLLRWGSSADAARLARELPDVLWQLIADYQTRQVGDGAALLFHILGASLDDGIVAVALAGQAIHEAPADSAAHPSVLLDHELKRPSLGADAYRELGSAAVDFVRDSPDNVAGVAGFIRSAETILKLVQAEQLAVWSDVIPSGFNLRLAEATRALAAWWKQPTESEREDEAKQWIERAAEHVGAADAEHRVDRLRMAARLIRYHAHHPDGPESPTDLADTVERYLSDGAWLNRAYYSLSRGSELPETQAFYDELAQQSLATIDRWDELAAPHLSEGARSLPDDVVGVEQVLDRVVGAVGMSEPVLLVVLDGMGWPSFLDLLPELERQGWHSVGNGSYPHPAALAAYPTVTEVSRASLLCGTLRLTHKESERRAFEAHPAITAVANRNFPATLIHKTELRVGGIDALPQETLQAVNEPRNKVIGIVLNMIDDSLKEGLAPEGGWDLNSLGPLRALLGAAQAAGRSVVITADHGHVLERDGDYRDGGPGGETGGERYRSAQPGSQPGEGEILVQGHRVLTSSSDNDAVGGAGTGSSSVIMPWRQNIRYVGRRSGYHGGLTSVEAIVPVVVLATEEPAGWTPLPITAPAWWDWTPEPQTTRWALPPKPEPKPNRPSVPTPSSTPTLFDVADVEVRLSTTTEVPDDEPPAAGESDDRAVARIVASDHVQESLGLLRLDADEVGAALRFLDGFGGGFVGIERVAAELDRPLSRTVRFLNQLDRLLAIDGYSVIELAGSDVRFDRALLETQLGLEQR